MTQVRPDDVIAANRAGSPAAAAAVATGSKPVVQFVPKRISLWGALCCAPLLLSARGKTAVFAVISRC